MSEKKRKKPSPIRQKFPKRMQKKLVLLFVAIVLAFVGLIGRATYINAENGEKYTKDDFLMYVDDNGKIHFALKADVENNDGAAVTFDYIPDGEYTRHEEKESCNLKFDPSSGRIVSIDIPATYNADGTVASYTTMKLEATVETDQYAYDQAYAEYEYKQYLYDKEQTEIDARTEKIQIMDRNLELKLQRLDTQRTQITTEMEALKKVLNDNIESSYKSFSG